MTTTEREWGSGKEAGLLDWQRKPWEAGLDHLLRRRKSWEWSWDDLVKRVADEVLERREYGPLGAEVLPSRIRLTLNVMPRHVATVDRFVRDPEFKTQVDALVLNRLDRTPHYGLPTIELEVVEAGENSIEVQEMPVLAPTVLRLQSNWSGEPGWQQQDYRLADGQSTFTLGRGRWHGPTDLVRNDVQLPAGALFVSRRAATLRRVGHLLQVSSRDQGRHLVVRWKGAEMRPDRAAMNTVEVGVGGTITFNGFEAGDSLMLELLSPEPE